MTTSSAKSTLPVVAFVGLFLFSCGYAAAPGKLTPKSVPVQVRLAEEMTANEDWEEAARRWIDILYYFGPSDQEARAEFELGGLALHRGRSDLAVAQWEKTVARHPESAWAERAAKALRLLGKEPLPPAEVAQPYITEDTPDDERQLLVAEGCFAQGLYIFAIRDFLKITNIHPGSARAAEARFRVGTCQAILGRPDLAVEQWQRVIDDYPESPQARMARGGIAAWKAVLDINGNQDDASSPVLDVGWQPFRSTSSSVDRGLSYAEDLYENANTEYALQEYAKVLCGIYTPKGGENPHEDYARYRMGVSAYRLGMPDAAARQWRRLLADCPESPWAKQASRALATVGVTDAFSSDAGRPALAVPDHLPSTLVQRYHLAAQLFDCELPLVASKEYLKVIHVLTAGQANPYQAEASYRLGECHHVRGRPDLARAVWQETAETYPESEWAEKARAAIDHGRRRESVLSQSHPTSQD